MNKDLIEVLKLFLTKVSNSSSLQKYSLDVHIQSREVSIIAPIPAKESKTYKDFISESIREYMEEDFISFSDPQDPFEEDILKITMEVKSFEDKTMITIYIQNDK